jgi:hypothetical protein
MWSDPGQRKGFYPPGFGMRGTDILFPLTKRLALFGVFNDAEGVQTVSDEQVATFNAAVVIYADSQIYAESPRFKYSINGAPDVRFGGDILADERLPVRIKSQLERRGPVAKVKPATR